MLIRNPSNARSRRTRSSLLAATRELLEKEGFEALSMEAVAGRANVTRRAVYLHFASRSELVLALFDYIAAAEGLDDSLQKVWEAPNAASALDEWAQHLARYHPRLLAVNRALQRVYRSDPDAARHRQRVMEEQFRNCRRLADWIQEEGCLSDQWTVDSACDLLWALISDDMIERLRFERGWLAETLGHQLGVMLSSTLIR